MKTAPPRTPPDPNRMHARSGLAFFGLMMILSMLSLVGVMVYTVVNTNIDIAGHQKKQQEAFLHADGGLMYVTARINQDILSGAITLGPANIAVNYPAPAGSNFNTVTNLTQLSNDRTYLFHVTGRSGPAETTLEGVVGRDLMLGNIGVFGDNQVDLQPGFDVYSYDSTVVSFPTISDSTGQAGVGSNLDVTMQPGADIDGGVMLGAATDGTPATFSGPATIPVSSLGNIDPDPLGAIGGALAVSFTHYSSALNNDNAAAGIVGNQINVGAHDHVALGSGIYYLTDLCLGPHASLELFATPDNPVVIFLSGPLTTQPSSTILNTGNSPRSLYIFSNSSSDVRLQPNGTFMGFVYTPYADLHIQPNNNAYGLFWGNTVLLQPMGDLYLDVAAHDDFLSNNMNLTQWKEIR